MFCGCLVLISLLCIPKATLRLDDTLMGLIEVRKAIIVTSPANDSKKRLRSAKGKHTEGRVQAQASGSPLQVESHSTGVSFYTWDFGSCQAVCANKVVYRGGVGSHSVSLTPGEAGA